MQGKHSAGGLLRNPFVFGAIAGLLVIFFSILIVSLAVGIQMGLFRHHRNMMAGRKLCGSEKVGITGSVTILYEFSYTSRNQGKSLSRKN